MSKTTVPTGDNKAKILYQEKVFRDSVKESYFAGNTMMGESEKSAIQVKNDLQKDKGEKIRFMIRMRLGGNGVTDDEILENNERSLTTYTLDATVHQYRQAVRDHGALDRQRSMYDIPAEHKMALQEWGAEKIDQLIFDMMCIGSGAASDPSKVFYRDGATGAVSAGSAATAKAALTAANSKLTPTMCAALAAWAKNGGARSYVPIRPLMIEGKPHYVLLVHDDVGYDIRNDSTYQQFVREAEVRGKDNPLFTGAIAIVHGVVIHTHENVAIATDGGGASVAWSKGLFFGQQAGVWGWGQRPKIVERDFDYGNEEGTAWGILAAPKKTVFNSLDYGSVGVWLARTNVSGL